MFGSFLPGLWLVGTTKVYSGIGADIVMESITRITQLHSLPSSDLIVANDGVCQETSIWRALDSRLRSKTVQFRQVRRELPHNFPATDVQSCACHT